VVLVAVVAEVSVVALVAVAYSTVIINGNSRTAVAVVAVVSVVAVEELVAEQ